LQEELQEALRPSPLLPTPLPEEYTVENRARPETYRQTRP
jgi:hypothetical protein